MPGTSSNRLNRCRIGGLHHRLRDAYRQVRLIFPLHKSPKRIARGISIGVSVAFLPAIGFQMGLAWVIGSVFNASRPAAMAAVWITNPWTAGPTYALMYMVGRPFWFGSHDVGYWELGRAIQGPNPSFGPGGVLAVFQNVFGLGTSMLVPMLIGGLIVGTAAGFFSYYPAKWAATSCQRFKRRLSGKTRAGKAAVIREATFDYEAHPGDLEYFPDPAEATQRRKAA